MTEFIDFICELDRDRRTLEMEDEAACELHSHSVRALSLGKECCHEGREMAQSGS